MFDTQKILENFATLTAAVDRAESRLDAGKTGQALIGAQIAATFAWFNHSGMFVDSRLERLLTRIGSLLDPWPITEPAAVGRRVLHIASALYQSGGHTQMLVKWVQGDPGSSHCIATTRQGLGATPEKISSLNAAPVMHLDRTSGDLLKRARMLRSLADRADYVVVHAHPDDVLPVVALSGSATPRIWVNHADHVFWVGPSVAKTVLHMRRSGADLGTRRRGLGSQSSWLMNRPLEVEASDRSRAQARASLNLRESDVVVVSAASANKYVPIDSGDMVAMLKRAVLENPNMQVRVAGPDANGPWHDAEYATKGRMRALGRLDSIRDLLAAADIYVDSFPFSSLTSMLEAGAHGLPLVSFRGLGEGTDVLGADSPGIDEFVLYPDNPQSFHDVLATLAHDPAQRAQRGQEVTKAIRLTHDDTWSGNLQALYAAAGQQQHSYVVAPRAPQTGKLDRAILRLQCETGYAAGIDGAMRAALPNYPPLERLATWARLRTRNVKTKPRELARVRTAMRLKAAKAMVLAVGPVMLTPVSARSARR